MLIRIHLFAIAILYYIHLPLWQLWLVRCSIICYTTDDKPEQQKVDETMESTKIVKIEKISKDWTFSHIYENEQDNVTTQAGFRWW